MATEKSTREQVEELFDKGHTEAEDIASRIGKTPATVYVHLRKIRTERGLPSRGRGRPPKVQTEGEQPTKTTTRKAPPKAGQKSNTKSTAKTPAKSTPAKAPTAKSAPAPAAPASTNGHAAASEFPEIKQAIEKELHVARRRVAKLERMLAPFES